MELKELYTKVGGDLDTLLSRFVNETRVNRFLGLFLKDPSFNELQAAVEASDWPSAFRAVHTLKGVAANMSFDRLAKSSSELTEALRAGNPLRDYALFDAVCADYTLTIEAVREYIASIQ